MEVLGERTFLGRGSGARVQTVALGSGTQTQVWTYRGVTEVGLGHSPVVSSGGDHGSRLGGVVPAPAPGKGSGVASEQLPTRVIVREERGAPQWQTLWV